MTLLDETPHHQPSLPNDSWLPVFPCHPTLSERNSPRSLTEVPLVSAPHNSYSNKPVKSSTPHPPHMPPRPLKSSSLPPANSLVDAADATASHRQSSSMPRLPPLDLKALHAPCAVPTELRPERRQIESISTSLSCFRPYLFVGGDAAARDVANLRSNNITHIVNLAGNSTPNYHSNNPSFKYLRLYVRDDVNQSLDHIFAEVGVFVDEARQRGTACFIHCLQGVSRSVTAALAYVMSSESISWEHAMREMLSCRSIAAPNRGFINILTELDSIIKHGRKRPRLYLLTNQRTQPTDCSNFVQLTVVKQTPPNAALHRNHVYILERTHRKGFVVWRGANVNDATWDHAVRISRRMAEQQAKHISNFAASSSLASRHKPLELFEQGESVDAEEELIGAMTMPLTDEQTY